MPTKPSQRERRPKGLGPARAAAALLAALALCAATWAVGAPAATRFSRDWLAAALTSRLTAICAVCLLGGAAGIVVLGRALWIAGRAGRRRPRGQEGTALLEFVMVLPVALTLVLVMTQVSLLMGGNLCVHYAAFCAARTAAVQVPVYCGDVEPWNVVASRDPKTSGKLETIRRAAVWAVMPVSCGNESYPAADDGGLRDGLAEFFRQYGQDPPGWLDGRVARKLQYANDYTEVELAPPADAANGGSAYAVHEDLEVTVRHVLYLSVPYANLLFARLVPGDGRDLGFGGGEYGLMVKTTCALSNEGGQDYVDVERFDVR